MLKLKQLNWSKNSKNKKDISYFLDVFHPNHFLFIFNFQQEETFLIADFVKKIKFEIVLKPFFNNSNFITN